MEPVGQREDNWISVDVFYQTHKVASRHVQTYLNPSFSDVDHIGDSGWWSDHTEEGPYFKTSPNISPQIENTSAVTIRKDMDAFIELSAIIKVSAKKVHAFKKCIKDLCSLHQKELCLLLFVVRMKRSSSGSVLYMTQALTRKSRRIDSKN